MTVGAVLAFLAEQRGLVLPDDIAGAVSSVPGRPKLIVFLLKNLHFLLKNLHFQDLKRTRERSRRSRERRCVKIDLKFRPK